MGSGLDRWMLLHLEVHRVVEIGREHAGFRDGDEGVVTELGDVQWLISKDLIGR